MPGFFTVKSSGVVASDGDVALDVRSRATTDPALAGSFFHGTRARKLLLTSRAPRVLKTRHLEAVFRATDSADWYTRRCRCSTERDNNREYITTLDHKKKKTEIGKAITSLYGAGDRAEHTSIFNMRARVLKRAAKKMSSFREHEA